MYKSCIVLGVHRIDRHHAEITDILYDIIDLVEARRKNAIIYEKFGLLENRLGRDFMLEDRLMRESGFPAALTHTAQHDELLQHVEEVRSRLDRAGTTCDLNRYDTQYLLSWFINHIHEYDTPLCRHLAKEKLSDEELQGYYPPIENQRNATRLFLEAPTEIVFSDQRRVKGHTKDLSFSGMAFAREEAPDREEEDPWDKACLACLALTMEEKTVDVTLPLKTVRRGEKRIGFQFMQVDPHEFRHVRDYLAHHHAQPDALLKELR